MFPDIEQTETEDRAAVEALFGGIVAYNDSKTGLSAPALPLGLLIRDPQTRVVNGGLWAVSYYDWMFIQFLVLPESLRGQGLGTELIGRAEAVARERGCCGIWLDSFSFQAPGFYEKLGFSRFGVIDQYPEGHSRVFLSKRLDPAGAAA